MKFHLPFQLCETRKGLYYFSRQEAMFPFLRYKINQLPKNNSRILFISKIKEIP